MAGRIPSLLRTVLRRRRFEDDLAEEMRFHLEERTADLVRSGVPPAEAARRARRELGSVDNVKTDCRQASGLRWLDELEQNLRHSWRRLAKSPGFTATALATLVICIGANLTVFAVVDSVLLRPLPFPDAGRLVRVYNTYPKAGVPDDGSSVANYYERRGHLAAFSHLALYRDGTAIVGERGATRREPVTRVSPDFFATLGMGPAMGRGFTDAETSWLTDDVAIVSDGYWRQQLGGDARALGRKLRLDGAERTVVGILPRGFSFLSSRSRIFVPLASDAEARSSRRRHSGSSSQMVARLAPGAALAAAQRQVDAHNAAMEADGPEAKMMADAGFRSLVVPLRADHVAAIRPTLLLMQSGALFLLAIGAVNLANLLLIRASGRLKEVAVRQAIGSGRGRVIAEAMVETTALTLLGGLLGLAAGAAGVRLLGLFGTERLPMGANVAFDARLALVALAGALLVGLGLGAPIAWYNLRGLSSNALRSESRGGTAGRAAQRLRHGFVVAQIALSFVLLAGAGLLALSLEEAMAASPGFRPANVLSGEISLPGARYETGSARVAFTERLLERLGRQPGVGAVGIATNVPFSGNDIKSAARVKGLTLKPGESVRGHYSYAVTGDYFAALGMSLVEGRFLTAADSRRDLRACVVDADFARHYWPRGGALGQRLFQGGEEGDDAEAFTVVGVVAPAKQAGLTDDTAQGAVFYPYAQRLDGDFFVVARTVGSADALAATLRRVVREIDPELPVDDVRSMDDRIAASLVARRSPALLAALFAAIAIVLTAIGTYGVLSYAVAQRRREIGLRMALGARPAQVRGELLGLAWRLIAVGIVIGVAGAALTGRAMEALLFHVPAMHAGVLAATVATVAAVALLACLLPSHRATRIPLIEALAEE